jgi:hypothetical protein
MLRKNAISTRAGYSFIFAVEPETTSIFDKGYFRQKMPKIELHFFTYEKNAISIRVGYSYEL